MNHLVFEGVLTMDRQNGTKQNKTLQQHYITLQDKQENKTLQQVSTFTGTYIYVFSCIDFWSSALEMFFFLGLGPFFMNATSVEMGWKASLYILDIHLWGVNYVNSHLTLATHSYTGAIHQVYVSFRTICIICIYQAFAESNVAHSYELDVSTKVRSDKKFLHEAQCYAKDIHYILILMAPPSHLGLHKYNTQEARYTLCWF